MSLVVKIRGSSVRDAERIYNVARIITESYKEGNDVVVVVSAQGDTTDDLINKALRSTHIRRAGRWICSFPQEQISIALCAMAIESWFSRDITDRLAGKSADRPITATPG